MKLKVSLLEKSVFGILLTLAVVLFGIFLALMLSVNFTFLSLFWWCVIPPLGSTVAFLLYRRMEWDTFPGICRFLMSLLTLLFSTYNLGMLILEISGGFDVYLENGALEAHLFGYGARPFFFYALFCGVIALLIKPEKQKADAGLGG